MYLRCGDTWWSRSIGRSHGENTACLRATFIGTLPLYQKEKAGFHNCYFILFQALKSFLFQFLIYIPPGHLACSIPTGLTSVRLEKWGLWMKSSVASVIHSPFYLTLFYHSPLYLTLFYFIKCATLYKMNKGLKWCERMYIIYWIKMKVVKIHV